MMNSAATVSESSSRGSVTSSSKHMVFTLAGERYAIPLSAVKEVIAMTEIRPVPHVAPFFKGLVNLRGRIISVVDLRVRLGVDERDYESQKTSIVITDVNDLTIGNIVDDVDEVRDIHEADIERSLDISTTVRREFVSGVAKHGDEPLILMLDAGRILSSVELELIRSTLEAEGAGEPTEPPAHQ